MKVGRLQLGQSTLEGAITLLLFVSFMLILIQLMWLLLAQQMMQSATIQITRYFAAGGSSSAELMVMQQRLLNPIPGYSMHLPRIKRLQPSEETIRQFGEYDVATDRFRLPADFIALRVQQVLSEEERERALLAYVLQKEVIYCMPLHVPLAGGIIRQLNSQLGDLAAQLYCDALTLSSAPKIPIRTRAAVPIEHDIFL